MNNTKTCHSYIWTFFSFAGIVLYFFSDTLGFMFMFLIYMYIFFFYKRQLGQRLVIALILSIPTSYIGIFGKETSHLISFFSISVVAINIYGIISLVNHNKKINLLLFIMVIYMLTSILAVSLLDTSDMQVLIDWVQIVIMLITICIAYESSKALDYSCVDEYMQIFGEVVVGVSGAVIFQYICFHSFHLTFGFASHFAGRVSFDVLFRGYSEVSSLIGIGIVYYISKLLKKIEIHNLIYMSICLCGIALNTSRTGLVSAAIVTVGMILVALFKKGRLFQKLLTGLLTIVSIIIALSALKVTRQISYGILEDNGRFETYRNGLSLFLQNTHNFLFGVGLNLSKHIPIMPHNFVIETLVTMGVISSAIIFGLIFLCLYRVRKSEYMYVGICAIVCSMFVTSFFEKNYVTVLFVILVILLNSLNPVAFDKQNASLK